MKSKVIDFKKSKEKLIKKHSGKLREIEESFGMTSKEHSKFRKAYEKCKETLLDGKDISNNEIDDLLKLFAKFFECIYKEWHIADISKAPKLKEAMDYAMLSSGKRLRPFLMYLTFDFCNGENFMVLIPFMLSLEMIHNFSLIHDDLPCIDNDELRRGKETVWKKYGEDVAVLTGDALLMQASTLMLGVINDSRGSVLQPYFASVAYIITSLAGLDGMLQGEFIDVINSSNKKMTTSDIIYMYEQKTTALFVASILSGAALAINRSEIIDDLEKFAGSLGNAFQIQDDILEVEGDVKTIGKSVNSDKANGKFTLVDKIGLKEAKLMVKELFDDCNKIIDKLTIDENKKTSMLYKKFIEYLSKREK